MTLQKFFRLLLSHSKISQNFQIDLNKDEDKRITNFMRRASTGVKESLSSELQPQPERPLDMQEYSRPIRRASMRASMTFTSIANDIGNFFGVNKTMEEETKENKEGVFHEISEDEAKFEALKITLRNKEIFTNEAIQQYLLNYDHLGFSSTKSSNAYQSSETVQKEKNCFRWKVQSEPSFRRYQNIKTSIE